MTVRKTEDFNFKFLALLAILALAAVYFVKPGTGPLPECLLYKTTGLYCPLCGSTRAFHELLHFHFLSAASMNLPALVIMPAVAALLVWERIKGRELLGRWKRGVFWALLALFLFFGVIRNLPFQPFSSLAPGGFYHSEEIK